MRVCPESLLEINDPEIRMVIFYSRMLQNRVSQNLMTEEESKERYRMHSPIFLGSFQRY
jgi:hypothetical protein